MKEKGSKPEREYVEARNVRELVEDFLQSRQADVKKGRFAPRTYDWYFAHLNSFAKFIDSQLTIARPKPFHVQNWLDKSYANSGGAHQHGAVRSPPVVLLPLRLRLRSSSTTDFLRKAYRLPNPYSHNPWH